MSEHKAPAGKFIVGESDRDEDLWSQVGDPYDTYAEANTEAKRLNHLHPNGRFSYAAYDENGLVNEALASTA